MVATPAGAAGRGHRHDVASLLEVAVTLFTERGYDGTSMGALADAAGLSKSSLYHHIDSKEQLLRLALEQAVEPLFDLTREAAAQQGPAIARLEHVVARTVHVLVDRLPVVTLLLRVHGNTATERWALERRREFDQIVAELVERARMEGDVRDDVDARVVTRLLFGMINSLVEWYRPPGSDDAVSRDDLAQAVVRLAFDGLRRTPADP